MTRLVDLVAPRGWEDALLKSLAFLVLINLLNLVLVTARGAAYELDADLGNTTAVALPFIALIMATLAHQRRLQHRLAVLASTDMLTGLPNRRAFLARAVKAAEGGRGGALLLLDADHFKRINDLYGHAVGDVCLRAIGERLRVDVTAEAIIGRLGGEEFSVFLPGASRDEALDVGRRLCRVAAVAAEGAAEDLRITLSAGAALGVDGVPLDRLMTQADSALYRAKAEGRARVVLWEDTPLAV